MAITIRDVAKLAGVAPSTVSRVIANSSRISQRTKRRVLQAMKELGYHPNYHARSLAIKKTKCLGIIMPSSTEQAFLNPFFPEVLRGISVCANQNGYALFLSTGGNEQEQREAVRQMIQGRRVDGVLFLYSKWNDPLLEYVEEQKIPYVLIGKPKVETKKCCYVDNDNVAVAKEATVHLIDLGHRRIGFVGGNRDLVVTKDRLRGYKESLEEAGLSFQEQLTIEQSFLEVGGYQAVHQLLELDQPPTAFVVVDDLMALGVLSALHDRGLKIPDDVSIVSINDVPIAKLATPPLTSVNIGIYDLGYEATNKLINWIKTEVGPSSATIIPHQLVTRFSTAKIKT